MRPFSLKKIDHIVLRVCDLEKSIQFYTQIMGCEIASSRLDCEGGIIPSAGRTVENNGGTGVAHRTIRLGSVDGRQVAAGQFDIEGNSCAGIALGGKTIGWHLTETHGLSVGSVIYRAGSCDHRAFKIDFSTINGHF